DDEDDYVEYVPPAKRRKHAPVWLSALLALAGAAGLGVAAYAPGEEWYALSGGRDKRSAPKGSPDVQITTDGFGNRWITLDGKKVEPADFGGGGRQNLEIPPLPGNATPRGPWVVGLAIAGAVVILAGTLAA